MQVSYCWVRKVDFGTTAESFRSTTAAWKIVQDEVLLLRQLLVGADHAETIEING
jgi:hypothetical protein